MKIEGRVAVASPYNNWGNQPGFELHPDIEGLRLNWYSFGPFGMLVPYPVGLSRQMRTEIEEALKAQ